MHRKRKCLTDDELILKGQRRRLNDIEDNNYESLSDNHAGTVSHILLRNFMCHSLLEVEFKNNINFIVGHNGSGKSAILTSLIIGLGGKATFTNRGNSIKAFIKAGKNSSSIEITLTNEGPMAYKPNIYGKRIKVIRNFTASGSSSYRIKSESGAVISTHAKEVHHICLSLNIQVDNPVCILTQDTSRNFLHTSNTQQKFKLFMRATRLEALQQEYQQINENKANAISLMRNHEKEFQELKENILELKKKLENLRSVVELQERISLMQKELLWAKVSDLEQELQEKEDAVQKMEAELRTAREEVENFNQRTHSVENEITLIQNKIDDIQRNIVEQKRPVYDLTETLKTFEKSYMENIREKNILERDVKNKNLDVENLQKEISKITENLEQIEEEKTRRLQELSNMEEKIKGIRDLLETSQNEKFQLQNSIRHRLDEEYNLNKEIVQMDNQTESIHNRLNSIKSETSNLVLYGRDMPTIINVIQGNKHRFRHMPKGPLGSYIKLNDKKWAVAVEGFIGASILKAFTVDNQNDNTVLMKIFNDHWTSGGKPAVITSKFFFKPHDVSKNLVRSSEGCLSIYEAVEISDPVVTNCLIDQLGIESILLIPTTDKAIELMSNASNVPVNCRQGVTITGDKYYPDPNYKMYSSRYKSAQFLQVSKADMIRQLETQIKDLEEKKKSTKTQHKHINNELREQKEKLKALDIKVTKLNHALNTLNGRYEEVRATENPDITNVHELENELKELKTGLVQRQITIDRIENIMEETRAKSKETEDNLKKAKDILRGLEDRLMPLQQQLANMQSKQNESAVNIQFAQQRLTECNNKYKLAKSEYLAKKTIVDVQTNQAVAVGERPNNVRQVNEIVVDINETTRLIKKVENSAEKPEDIAKQIESKTVKYNQTSEILDALRNDVKELQIATEKRKKFYKRLQDYFVTVFSSSFERVLSFRQFKGEVEIDLKNQKLDLIVIPQQGSQGLTSTANLSGGERSFSTVAFLYSLWQCMEFPFYILDEFDVFMDKVNRTKIMEILLSHAKSARDKQFVFLTPQDISFIHDKQVAIHRLEDPERAPIA